MNVLATIVACYGLLQDSVAVVIGAMVIATLLGPIFGVALALVDGDNAVLAQGVLAAIGGVGLGLCIAVTRRRDSPGRTADPGNPRRVPGRPCSTWSSPWPAALPGPTPTVSPHGAGLVGVAIATALVPPLSVCGLLPGPR